MTPYPLRLFRLPLLLSGIFILTGLLSNSGCKHRPVVDMDMPPDDTTMVQPCHPDTVYFQLQILPILVSNCALPGCHSAISPQEGIELTSYQKVMQTADIKPGDLDGDLWEAINETDPEKRMPRPPSPPLTAEQINLIRTWILQGAKDLTCDPTGVCDTVGMSFANDIQPILNTYCTGCHGGSAPLGGINLSNFSGVSVVVNNNRILGAIRRQPGFSPMPQGGNPLPECHINQIAAWINQGAQNN